MVRRAPSAHSTQEHDVRLILCECGLLLLGACMPGVHSCSAGSAELRRRDLCTCVGVERSGMPESLGGMRGHGVVCSTSRPAACPRDAPLISVCPGPGESPLAACPLAQCDAGLPPFQIRCPWAAQCCLACTHGWLNAPAPQQLPLPAIAPSAARRSKQCLPHATGQLHSKLPLRPYPGWLLNGAAIVAGCKTY